MTYLLALATGAGSVGLYLLAFFFPELYRRYDLIWSGVGLFYALALWICAGQVRGAMLLSHAAAIALLGWFVWQNLALRYQLVPTEQHTPQAESKQSFTAEVANRLGHLGNWLSDRFGRSKA
ncbi:MAG: Ycf66 family protein [Elainellaceae cyanobacterium]